MPDVKNADGTSLFLDAEDDPIGLIMLMTQFFAKEKALWSYRTATRKGFKPIKRLRKAFIPTQCSHWGRVGDISCSFESFRPCLRRKQDLVPFHLLGNPNLA